MSGNVFAEDTHFHIFGPGEPHPSVKFGLGFHAKCDFRRGRGAAGGERSLVAIDSTRKWERPGSSVFLETRFNSSGRVALSLPVVPPAGNLQDYGSARNPGIAAA